MEYQGYTFDSKRVLINNVQKSYTTNSTDGESFTKHYLIQASTTASIYKKDDCNEYMIRLDEPIISLNEDLAPFSSKLHRIFATEEEIDMWKVQ
ncbi:hypothetical protein [Brevibacillus sp. NRS-1366]|uniref:hypothetical protein n=1 Tax=Brevibacillus sp. NRS-1366 TaxID=3233899 RepID=UPI003D1B1F1F